MKTNRKSISQARVRLNRIARQRRYSGLVKTTTYLCEGGVTTATVSYQPVLTPERYAHACRVLNMAALAAKSREQAVDILREAATKTQLYSACWNALVHAAQHLDSKGGRS